MCKGSDLGIEVSRVIHSGIYGNCLVVSECLKLETITEHLEFIFSQRVSMAEKWSKWMLRMHTPGVCCYKMSKYNFDLVNRKLLQVLVTMPMPVR